MTSPVLLVVDDDAQAMAALEQALHRRYGADDRVVAEQFPVAAVESLERMRSQAGPVALVIADQWMPQITGVDLLARTRQLHPSAGSTAGC